MNLLIERMKILGFTKQELSYRSLVSINIINDLCAGLMSWDKVNEVDKIFISSVLLCDPNYFSDINVRSKDLPLKSFNDGEKCVDVNYTKGQLQQLARDYINLKELLNEYKKNEKTS